MQFGSLRVTIVSAASFFLAVAAFSPASAQPGIGADYGARDPASCASRSEPAQGAPSNAQAVQYFKCNIEGIGDGRLYLMENVEIQVNPQGRAYNPQSDYFENIDASKPVYAIRGSMLRYACVTPNANNAGKNCTAFREPNAVGYCYKTTANEWICNMSDIRQQSTELYAPPK